MILRLIIIFSLGCSVVLTFVRDYVPERLITNLIIYNYTRDSRECQENDNKFMGNRKNCINYTHNFVECQKNLQKYQNF